MPIGKLVKPVYITDERGDSGFVAADLRIVAQVYPLMALDTDADAWDWRLGPYGWDDLDAGGEWGDLDEFIIDLE